MDNKNKQPTVSNPLEHVVMNDLTEPLNQCDGCMAGMPLVNGVHKDHQTFGIGCTKHLYVKSS